MANRLPAADFALRLAIPLAWLSTVVLPAGAAAQSSAEAKSPGICLTAHSVARTEVIDSTTILFHMRDGRVWKNTLSAPCATLPADGGFAYAPVADRICGGVQHIRVLQSGELCLLGAFSPYSLAPGTPSPAAPSQ